MENARRRAADEKVVRIDHSDVYLENDRLSEELYKSLDSIFREKHRKFISHAYEISQLRQAVSKAASKNSKTLSSVAALRPHTTPTYTRTRAPRVVKLDVHVPSTDPVSPATNGHQDSGPASADHASSSDDDDDDGDDEEEDESANDTEGSDDGDVRRKTRGNIGRVQSGQNSHARGVGGGGVEMAKDANQNGDVSAPRKVTKQQLLLDRLKLSKVPQSWFTDVLPASGPINTKRRATSALPYMTAGSNRASGMNSSSTGTRKPRSAHHRGRRAKSAKTPASRQTKKLDGEESVLVCGGEQDGSRRGTELRSRRRLMELSGLAGEESVPGAANSRRAELREAARLERERLDARVKLFLQSCDRVHVGGISSRKERHFSRMFLGEIYNT